MTGEVENLVSRTKRFALRVIRLYSSPPKQTLAQALGKQVLKSGTSVGANYREAFRARSTAEFVAKMGECVKELEETSYWLELLVDANLFADKRLSPLRDEYNQLLSIFVSIIKSKKRNS